MDQYYDVKFGRSSALFGSIKLAHPNPKVAAAAAAAASAVDDESTGGPWRFQSGESPNGERAEGREEVEGRR